MLRVDYLNEKLKELELAIRTTPKTPPGKEYIAHIERLSSAYGEEYLKALKRPLNRKLQPNERTSYRRKEFEKTAHEIRGY